MQRKLRDVIVVRVEAVGVGGTPRWVRLTISRVNAANIRVIIPTSTTTALDGTLIGIATIIIFAIITIIIIIIMISIVVRHTMACHNTSPAAAAMIRF
jgi:hypothetical protein